MPIKNVEIKARCADHEPIRKILKSQNARFVGRDDQTDTYFRVNEGRLKLREGNIENALIYYRRDNKAGPKESDVRLFETEPNSPLKSLLSESLGILVEVKKKREIYFIGNVKFHLDDVAQLGSFVEIEAIDEDGSIGIKELDAQCNKYLAMFGIKEADLISNSYSDMLLEMHKGN